jgi:hypothetical protein
MFYKMMMLNRNNYEEFFLLYVDNELPDADRKAVEAFLRQNPDLEGELNLLLGTKMKPEHQIHFHHKELLFKHPETDLQIDLDNYQNYFLLYTDNELTSEHRKNVEAFASQDEFLLNELALFQQTRVEADLNLVFENKELLYRVEKRIGWFTRISLAAAVLLLIVAGYLAFNLNHSIKPAAPVVFTVKKNVIPPVSISSPDKKDQLAVTLPATEPLYKTDKLNNRSGMKIKIHQEEKPQATRELSKAFTTRTQEITPSPEVATINVIPLASVNSHIIPPVDHASILDLHADKEDGIDLASASDNKNKMRGVFRKVSRIFEKTTSAGEDKTRHGILIGGFQIALK